MALSKVLTWNAVSSASQPHLIIGEVLRDPIGGIRTQFKEVAGMEGSWVFPQKRGMRKISVEMAISAPDKATLDTAMVDFANWIDVQGEARLIFSDKPGVYYLATLDGVELESEWNGLAKLRVSWMAQPYALSTAITTEAWQYDKLTPGLQNHVWNADTGARVYPVITLSPVSGSIKDFTLYTNGVPMSYTGGNVLTGQYLTINSISGVVTSGPNTDVDLTGAYDPNLLVLQYVTGGFPELRPGSNTILMTLSGGTATLINFSVKFRKKFRR